MIRPVLTELALFLAPFVVYAIFLVATKAALLDRGVLAAEGARHARHRAR